MEWLYLWVMNLINNVGTLGIIFNCLLILVESIIPPLPLGLFITILFVNYGFLWGFLLSWLFTVGGCIISFYLFQTLFKGIVDKKIRKYEFANKLLKIIDKIKFNNLVLLIALPFTPAFVINIVCGISEMKFRKFFLAICIGKIFMVFFWGYLGVNILEAINNPIILLKVVGLLLIAYFISKYINKKFNLD